MPRNKDRLKPYSKKSKKFDKGWRKWKEQKTKDRQMLLEEKLMTQETLAKQEQVVKQEVKQKELVKQEPKKGQLFKPTSLENGKKFTISIAVPGSILLNAQSTMLKTYLVGQVARAATVFNVSEIVVFNDDPEECGPIQDDDDSHCCKQMAKILEYMECPQYLRKHFFPMLKDLQFAGVLNPLDAPHHLRTKDRSEYREGIVLDKKDDDDEVSWAYIGLEKNIVIDKKLVPGIRVTVKIEEKQFTHLKGTVVSPTVPYKQYGIYWGYNVRLAKNLKSALSDCPFKEGYDLTIGTSFKGENIDSCTFPAFNHMLIVFGGLKGLRNCKEVDTEDVSQLFGHYINACPQQGSRTIRTEEAILITLSALRLKLPQMQPKS